MKRNLITTEEKYYHHQIPEHWVLWMIVMLAALGALNAVGLVYSISGRYTFEQRDAILAERDKERNNK